MMDDFQEFLHEMLPPTGSLRDRIDSDEAIREKLRVMRPLYVKSKQRIDGTDEEWEVRKTVLESLKRRELHGFIPGQSDSSQALWHLGRIKMIEDELNQPRLIVMRYEELQKRLEEK